MIFNDSYRAYFEHQAIHHPELQHSEAAKVFEVVDIDEALGDLRTAGQPKGAIMRLFHYTYQISDQGSEEVRKHLQGGFLIAKYHSNRKDGSSGMLQALTDCERIVDEIIEKMIADSQAGHPLFYYSLNTAQNVFVSPNINASAAGFSGYVCTFRLANQWRNCTTAPSAPVWTDGGLTPF